MAAETAMRGEPDDAIAGSDSSRNGCTGDDGVGSGSADTDSGESDGESSGSAGVEADEDERAESEAERVLRRLLAAMDAAAAEHETARALDSEDYDTWERGVLEVYAWAAGVAAPAEQLAVARHMALYEHGSALLRWVSKGAETARAQSIMRAVSRACSDPRCAQLRQELAAECVDSVNGVCDEAGEPAPNAPSATLPAAAPQAPAADHDRSRQNECDRIVSAIRACLRRA
jgi:hypothetical protein